MRTLRDMRLVETQRPTAGGSEQPAPHPAEELDVTCRALNVALCAVELYIVWHSGVMNGDEAMAALEQVISHTTSRPF